MADSKPVVGVVMGSESDMEIMQRCCDQLEKFGIAYEVRIISAHRTPDVAHEYSATAADRGLKVIIAAAGLSAALPGILAANTNLPIIGVPIDSGPLRGVDSALSIMQMPPGVPVACMAIGKAGATNSAVYAAELLALVDSRLADELKGHKVSQAKKVAEKDASIRKRD